MAAIGIFEAKTKLSEIVRRAEAGERITITVRGRPVADIVPSGFRSWEAIRQAMERLMHPRIEGVDGDTVLEWIREGRK